VIVLSLVLVVASAAALGWGITTTSEELVWGSLLAGLAAVALVAGSVVRYRRRLAAGETEPAAPPAPSTPAPPQPPQQQPGAWPWSAGAGSADPAGPPGWTGPPTRSGWSGSVDPTPPAVDAPGPAGVAEPAPDAASAPPAPAGIAEPAPDAASAPPAPAGAVEPATGSGTTGATPGAFGPVGPVPPVEDPSRPAAGQPAAAALGAATDRPLGEPFPEPPEDYGEPPVEDVPVRDALRVAQLGDDVRVVDGHPRYHLDGCPTLAGAEPVALPVSAARRGGFTPCAICSPDRTLLARSRDRRPPPPTPADA
jgi:hypothetical protein